MENRLDEMTEEVKKALEKNDQALAASKIKKYLENVNKIPLNIAITGESGSGKSSFVNAFRDIDVNDERAAPTGCVETTMVVKDYPHPKFPNVTLWDLPGIGTPRFRADKYLEEVEFERFDFFIIISAIRFKENDVKLALEIGRMGKKFYFARSKTDNDLQAEGRRRDFDEERTLEKIRENCIQGLQNQGVMFPQVFLLSNFDFSLYDFPLLHKTLEKELPAHKKDALLFAMPNISLKIINKKKEAFQKKITKYALASAAGGAVAFPGGSVALDLALMVEAVTHYQLGFGLDISSLQRLADTIHVPLDDLKAVIKSPLGLQGLEKITAQHIKNLLLKCAIITPLMVAEEVLRFIPIFGTIVAAGLSYVVTDTALNTFLNMLAEDAQRVFEKALSLSTSV